MLKGLINMFLKTYVYFPGELREHCLIVLNINDFYNIYSFNCPRNFGTRPETTLKLFVWFKSMGPHTKEEKRRPAYLQRISNLLTKWGIVIFVKQINEF